MDSLENLRVLAGSKDFFRGLQHLHHQFKSGWRLLNTTSKEVVFFCCEEICGNDMINIWKSVDNY